MLISTAKGLLFYSLPWQRSGIISVNVKDAEKIGALKDAENSQVVPVSAKGENLQFEAQNVPAMGYKTYVITSLKVALVSKFIIDKENNTIETPYFKITLDPLNLPFHPSSIKRPTKNSLTNRVNTDWSILLGTILK